MAIKNNEDVSHQPSHEEVHMAMSMMNEKLGFTRTARTVSVGQQAAMSSWVAYASRMLLSSSIMFLDLNS